MPRSGRGALVSWNELEDGPYSVIDAVPLSEGLAGFEGDPCSLIFAVATLNLFVNILLHVSFENSRSGGFIEACGF